MKLFENYRLFRECVETKGEKLLSDIESDKRTNYLNNKNFDVIKSMSSKIWVFNESAQYIVEIMSSEIKVGLRPDRKKV